MHFDMILEILAAFINTERFRGSGLNVMTIPENLNYFLIHPFNLTRKFFPYHQNSSSMV